MNLHFVSYGDEKYYNMQDSLAAAMMDTGAFRTVFSYRRDWLEETDFYTSNKAILDLPRGGGYWAWKPHVILHALENTDDGDVILYLDVGTEFRFSAPGLRESIVEASHRAYINFRVQGEPQWKMTKRDCFVRMGCDEPRFWNASQIEAGRVIVNNTPEARAFVDEWRRWCCDPAVVTDAPNVCGLPNWPGFYDHRHDQSIATNLVTREGIATGHYLRQFIIGKKFL